MSFPPHLSHLRDVDVVRQCLSSRVFGLQRLFCRIREDGCGKEALFAASPSYGSCHLSPEGRACVCECVGVRVVALAGECSRWWSACRKCLQQSTASPSTLGSEGKWGEKRGEGGWYQLHLLSWGTWSLLANLTSRTEGNLWNLEEKTSGVVPHFKEKRSILLEAHCSSAAP